MIVVVGPDRADPGHHRRPRHRQDHPGPWADQDPRRQGAADRARRTDRARREEAAGDGFHSCRPDRVPCHDLVAETAHSQRMGCALGLRPLRGVRSSARNPDLILAGGDLITDGFQSGAEAVAPRWQAYLEHLHSRLKAPVQAAIGNHDLVAAIPEDGSPAARDPRAEFRARLGVGTTYRSLDAGGAHIVLLDPMRVVGGDLKYEGRVAADQLAWLEQDLVCLDPDTPVIAVTHMPLLTAFYQATEGMDFPAPANRVVVNNLDVLKRFSGRNLLLVLQGHLHVDEMLRWRGTTFVTGGAVCGKWWRGAWHGTREGFGVVTLRRDRVDWEYVTYGWKARRP